MAAVTFPQGVGVVELVAADIIITADHAFDAIKLELVDANGDGIETLLDYALALDLALRLAAACARLRRLMIP